MAEPGPPRIFLVRHGETDWNLAGRMMGRSDIPLNANGEDQARAVAEEMRGIRWDRAIASAPGAG